MKKEEEQNQTKTQKSPRPKLAFPFLLEALFVWARLSAFGFALGAGRQCLAPIPDKLRKGYTPYSCNPPALTGPSHLYLLHILLSYCSPIGATGKGRRTVGIALIRARPRPPPKKRVCEKLVDLTARVRDVFFFFFLSEGNVGNDLFVAQGFGSTGGIVCGACAKLMQQLSLHIYEGSSIMPTSSNRSRSLCSWRNLRHLRKA